VKQIIEIDESTVDIKKIDSYLLEIKEMETIFKRNEKIEKDISNLKEIIDNIEETDVLSETDIENHLELLNDLNDKSSKQLQLKQKIDNLESLYFDLENCEASIELYEDKIETLEQELKSIGKCPYCGSKLK